jgi:hypothetical protein
MASKLFHSVVGVGIALGVANVGCIGDPGATSGAQPDPAHHASGSDAQAPKQASPELPERGDGWLSSPNLGAVGAGQADDAGEASDGAEGFANDAGDAREASDAPDAALVMAFCDFAWPTTKGGPWPSATPPACVDPLNECRDAGAPMPCYMPASATWTCPAYGAIFPPCIAGRWQCPTSSWACANNQIYPSGHVPPDAGGH